MLKLKDFSFKKTKFKHNFQNKNNKLNSTKNYLTKKRKEMNSAPIISTSTRWNNQLFKGKFQIKQSKLKNYKKNYSKKGT